MQATRRLVLVHIAELRPAAKDDAAPIGRQTIPIQNPFGIHKHSRLGIELGCEPVWKLFSGNDKTRDRNEPFMEIRPCLDRKSVGEGKSVSVRVDLGGRRNIKKKKK